jgi:hypothetical protein
MAVIIENISIIIRETSLSQKSDDVWVDLFERHKSDWSKTFYDDDLLCISYFHNKTSYIECFIKSLIKNGLIFMQDSKAVDIAVIDSIDGLLTPAPWLKFARIPMDDKGGKIGVCWLFGGARVAFGTDIPEPGINGWQYADSFSQKDHQALQSINSGIENKDWYQTESDLYKKRKEKLRRFMSSSAWKDG